MESSKKFPVSQMPTWSYEVLEIAVDEILDL